MSYLTGYSGTQRTLQGLQSWSQWQAIEPEFATRLLSLMDEVISLGKPIGIGGSLRTTAQQTALFLARHHLVTVGGCCSYQGKRYALNAGVAHAAPPGTSYHEPCTPNGHCLAVDMTGNITAALPLASKHGLVHFAAINNEPWHFQPIELPHSRSQFKPSIHLPLKTFAATPTPKQLLPLPTLKVGSTGYQVQLLQSRLKTYGYYTSSIDGIFGAITKAALIKLQARLKVPQDGVYGPMTQAAWASSGT